MEIFTFPFRGNPGFYISPETVINRDSNDYYYPDEVRTVRVIPFVYARISRPCKSIAAKFASRHYDTVGRGIHLRPAMMTSALPREAVEPLCRYCDRNLFLGATTDAGEFRKSAADITAELDKAVEYASRFVSLRTGDMIVIEDEALQEADVREKQVIAHGDITINIR